MPLTPLRGPLTGPPSEAGILNRRRFLTAAGSIAALLASTRLPGAWATPEPRGGRLPDGLFTLGVASGDPLSDSVVLWTRLAPHPLAGGGMPDRSVAVQWQVAADEAFRRVLRRGTDLTEPAAAHSVHARVDGLQPGRWYWYRFKAGNELSPVGRTRTAPVAGADRLRFAFASCSQYEHGYFTAYRHIAEEGLDLVVHLGDYIYEYPAGVYVAPGGNVRHHVGPETTTLADYRQRLAQYKTDPDLQAAHAAAPWLVTWDDHELDNNYADEIPEDDQSRRAFLGRRAASYQAYWEHMPLSPARRPAGIDLPLYRRVTFGDLAQFHVLDTRQYRSDQPCGDRVKPPCPERSDPVATLTGARQERWLLNSLDRSRARWNVLAQQVFMAQRDFTPGEGETYSMDAWDGYLAARDRLLEFLQRRRPSNPVVLTGDVHSHWVADLKANFDDPDSATLATEFVGTSITSGGDGVDTRPDTAAILAENPHIKFFNGQRGYVSCELTPQQWRAHYRVLPYVQRPAAPVRTRASFVIEDRRPGAQPA